MTASIQVSSDTKHRSAHYHLCLMGLQPGLDPNLGIQ